MGARDIDDYVLSIVCVSYVAGSVWRDCRYSFTERSRCFVAETRNTPFMAVVNPIFARRLWGESPPLGQHWFMSGKLMEVVGVVDSGKYHDLAESPQSAVVCAGIAQRG